MRRRATATFAAIATVLTLAGTAAASPVIVYSEAIQGDFSGLFSAPTPVSLTAVENEIIGTTGASSVGSVRDYFTFTIAEGAYLRSLTLVSSSLGDGGAQFMGLQQGPAFTFDPTLAGSHMGDFLGYTHFSPANNGSNLLLMLGANGIGFNGPLGAGQYTLWIQDTSGGVANYDLVAEVVPEPGTMLLMLSGLGVLAKTRRRRSS
jgi:hypothetical protein